MGAALGIDWGSKRSGFAITDALRIALEPLPPREVLGESEELLDHVAALLEERVIDTFVLGLPLNMDGTEGPMATTVRAFAARLSQRFPSVRLVFQDERLSTKEAEDWMREAEIPVKKRRAIRDSASAAVILRDWIAAGEP